MQEDSILIFRTSVAKKLDIKKIEILFAQNPGIHKWNLDFDDWEKVLRIECRDITAAEITNMLWAINIYASELE